MLIFWTNFALKEYFQRKTENITIEVCIFELVKVPNFSFKLAILIFWTKFSQIWYLSSKPEKVKTTIEFCVVFELV